MNWLQGQTVLRSTLSRSAVRQVDERSVSEYGVPGVVLMENAARGLLDAALNMLRHTVSGSSRPRVLVICGSGNNGGDGFALARHLANRGCEVRIRRLGEPREGSDAMINLRICRAMKLRESEVGSVAALSADADVDMIVDAIFGTGLDRAVDGLARDVIEWMNASKRPILAADVPSGLDCDTGEPLGVAVRATRTVTFVALKLGFLVPASRSWTGDVAVADIGAPAELIQQLGTPIV